jgi:hypothetical protein
MGFVQPSDPNAKFCIHVFRDEDDDDGAVSFYTNREAAEEAFGKLQGSKKFFCGGLYIWRSGDNYDCIDVWPEGWDGESPWPPA